LNPIEKWLLKRLVKKYNKERHEKLFNGEKVETWKQWRDREAAKMWGQA